MVIIGTAGHVDHGKSALVKALTATDPDRLPQEKARSLTIELGFASYTNNEGTVIGVIDVPGHERFIRNMVSGVWSLDLALLCIAADDGWMAQSTDHASVLKAITNQVPIVVITKADLVNEERLEDVVIEIEHHITSMFGLHPTIVITSTKNNTGIDELKEAIDTYLKKKQTPLFPPALALDRSFLIEGIGAVAAGSLRGMALSLGDDVTILPSGIKSKVRTLQSFGNRVESVGDGTRVAITLRGVEHEELPKGSLITNTLSFYTCAHTVFVLLEGTTLKRYSQLEVASLTWHDWAKVRIIGSVTSKVLLASITTEEIHPWYIGQKLVLIQSGSATIRAAGSVITAESLNKEQKSRLSSLVSINPNFMDELNTTNLFNLWLTGYAKGYDSNLILLGEHYLCVGSWVIKDSLLREYKKSLVERITNEKSVALGVIKQESLFPSALTQAIVDSMVNEKAIAVKGTHVELFEAEVSLSPEEEHLLKKITNAGFEGHLVKFLSKEEKPVIGLLRQKGLIVIVESTFIYPKETFDTITSLILKNKPIGSFFSIAEAKEHLPLSRKYILPLLNKLEEFGFVERIGNERRVVKTF